MPKFVIMLENGGYQSCTINAALAYGALTANSFSSAIMGMLFKIHNAWPINNKRELPLKSIWFSRILNEDAISIDDAVVFVFYESYSLSYSKQYLKHLKSRYSNSYYCFVFSNPICDYNLGRFNSIRNYYDIAISFNYSDANDYNFVLSEFGPYLLPTVSAMKNISDAFFVGSDKGRLKKIIDLYEELSGAGLKCDFNILGVNEKQRVYDYDINYTEKLPYQEVIRRISASRCIIEVLQDGCNYCSIRTAEAVQYNKKLLTTNKNIIHQPFYNPKLISVLSKTGNAEFLKTETNDVAYQKCDLWSFDRFAKIICHELSLP